VRREGEAGPEGNLIVNAFQKRPAAEPLKKAKRQGNQRGAPVAVLPAIPFEIVKKGD